MEYAVIEPSPGTPITKAIIYICDYNLTGPNRNKPIILEPGNSDETRFFSVRAYRDANGAQKYVAVGRKIDNGDFKCWIVRLNSSGAIEAQGFLQDVNGDVLGELRGVSLSYPSGSLPTGQPKVNNEILQTIITSNLDDSIKNHIIYYYFSK